MIKILQTFQSSFLIGLFSDLLLMAFETKMGWNSIHNRPTQLLNATGIEAGIYDCQVQKYQPSVTSRLMFII